MLSEKGQNSDGHNTGEVPIRRVSSSLNDLENAIHVEVPEKRGWRKLLAYIGPGFLVCIAYIDPGNFESNLQAGARFKYELLWVLLLASIGGLAIQSLAANLGVVTGRHLAEHCRSEYPTVTNFALWVVAEFAIIASDIPEVIGTAFAINMLFGLQVWLGVLLTGFSTVLLLAVQQYGVRKLEAVVSSLVLVIAFCFLIEIFYARPPIEELVEGLFIPRFSGTGATGIAISILGAVVMPHNLFLHSALVLSRKTPRSDRSIRDGCMYNLIEMSIALAVAFAINVSVIGVSGAVCGRTDLVPGDRDNCNNLDLNRAPFLLKNTLGSASSTLFAIALLASGQSSTITGTYAGQYVMHGFLQLEYNPLIRNFVTRMVAILPSLIVALIGGTRGAGELIIISSMILSFQLPYALIPLLKFTSSPIKMGPYVNSGIVTWLMWGLGFFIISVNVYYLVDIFTSWLWHSNLSIFALMSITILALLGISGYISSICYLAMRSDKEVTFVPTYDIMGEDQDSGSEVKDKYDQSLGKETELVQLKSNLEEEEEEEEEEEGEGSHTLSFHHTQVAQNGQQWTGG